MKQTVIKTQNRLTSDPLSAGCFFIGSVDSRVMIRLPIDEIPAIVKHLKIILQQEQQWREHQTHIDYYAQQLLGKSALKTREDGEAVK